MQKSEIVAKIEEVKKTLADLQEQLEKAEGWWEPKWGDEYWFIDSYLVSLTVFTRTYKSEEGRLESGNCYRTRAEAQKELDRRIALTAMRKYIAEKGIGWKEGARYIVSINSGGNPDWWNTWCHLQPDNIYIDTSDNARQFIKDQESNIKIYFGV